ncbi:MAG: conjugative transposon protein TraK [Crocinitomicaceae bacterium]|nr:conjugative transposon protein TraK [Crocinitomicaceae bacterium]
MFTKAKNMDQAFRQTRTVAVVGIALSTLVTVFTIARSFQAENHRKEQVLVLPAGKVIEAVATQRSENLPVEIRSHVTSFHLHFFTLDPDDNAIKRNVNKALYLADGSAKRVYDDLKENGYYAGIISGNVNQIVTVDSVIVDVNDYPYRFRCYATMKIIRPTTITTRNLITDGSIRNVSRSDNNPHGFLIERWGTIENRDLKTENRR